MKRQAIGDDPLDALPGRAPAAAPEARAGEARPGGPKAKMSFVLPAGLAEAARDAVVALSPTGLTLTGPVEAALARELERLAAEHDGGAPFPPRQHRELRPGRRIG